MENMSVDYWNTLLDKISAFVMLVKSWLLVVIDPLRPWIEPYEDIVIWLIPALLLLLLLLLILLVKRRRKKKVDVGDTEPEPKMAEESEAVLVPPDVKQVKEIDGDSELKQEQEQEEPAGILRNIRTGLEKTRKAFSTSVDRIFAGGGLDDDTIEELEELLITSDVGVKTSLEIIETLVEKKSEIKNAADLKRLLKEEIFSYINVAEKATDQQTEKPHVMMVIGVNGVGKTTTIGKLAAKFVKEGKKVLIVAADTFRAAASDQLNVWAERSGADIVRHRDNSDPSAVAFDGMEAAIARGMDIVIIDTAGRLHTKKNLMEELKKIERTVASKMPGAPHETVMVVDATTGQNALQQAQLFNDAVGIDTIVLTKLDGTAKGGIVVGITNTLNIPLKYVGVGEQVDDLQSFDAKEFADALI